MDRVADDFHIAKPAIEARYEILRQEYIRLAELNVVVGESGASMKTSNLWPVDEILPKFNALEMSADTPTNLYGQKLRSLAEHADGMSGRKLRALPERSICLSTSRPPCPIGIAIDAACSCVADGMETADASMGGRSISDSIANDDQ